VVFHREKVAENDDIVVQDALELLIICRQCARSEPELVAALRAAGIPAAATARSLEDPPPPPPPPRPGLSLLPAAPTEARSAERREAAHP